VLRELVIVLRKEVRGDRGGQARCLTYYSRDLENGVLQIRTKCGSEK
jgi:hypothetical protein